MPKGFPNPKPDTEEPAAEPFNGQGDHDGDGKPGGTAKTVLIRLLRNYRPLGQFEIVGHEKPAKFKKNAAGLEVEIEAAVFIEGEQTPPPTPGTGFETKIWAGTLIRLPVEEGKRLRNLGIGEYEIDD
jgi:hypothetical protein